MNPSNEKKVRAITYDQLADQMDDLEVDFDWMKLRIRHLADVYKTGNMKSLEVAVRSLCNDVLGTAL
jgi:hypothetical protein